MNWQNIAVQVALAVFGLTSLWLAYSSVPSVRRWSPPVGLCGQPFWVITAAQGESWGMGALAVAYTSIYARASWREWRIWRAQ